MMCINVNISAARGGSSGVALARELPKGVSCIPPTQLLSSCVGIRHKCLGHHITSHHITSHHITSHHITSHHITSHHITSHHIISPHPKRSPERLPNHPQTTIQKIPMETMDSQFSRTLWRDGAPPNGSYPRGPGPSWSPTLWWDLELLSAP